MFIKCLQVGPLPTNCYIVCDTVTNKAVIIDPGAEADRILSAFDETGCELCYVLLTHAHGDHIGGVNKIVKATGAKLGVSVNDADLLNKPELNCYNMIFSAPFVELKPDILLQDNQVLKFGDIEIKCIESPGHTKGGMCYLINDTIFSGDTLFKDAVGRTDLYSGSSTEIIQSIKKLGTLDGNLKILPGHGEFTTLADERENNPYFGEHD